MKKFWIWICLITCIFGLTACGSEEVLTEYEQQKVDVAEYQATNIIIPLLANLSQPELKGFFDGYTMPEVELQAEQLALNFGQQIDVDGYGFYSAVQSFQSGVENVGALVRVTGVTSKIDGKQIIVDVELLCEKKNATAELIFSNDMFLVLESAALNPDASMGELMAGAALNTLIGMGTVFTVLILISLIISCFKVIPSLQKKAAESKEKRKARKKAKKEGVSPEAKVETPVVQSSAEEESTDDDLELAAVIAAAIAAYEGSASTDGYVVRSVRRRWS